MYERMKSRVEKVVQSGGVCLDEVKESEIRDAFSKWTPNFSRRHHPTIIKVSPIHVVVCFVINYQF